jgi:hypothetical protein
MVSKVGDYRTLSQKKGGRDNSPAEASIFQEDHVDDSKTRDMELNIKFSGGQMLI